MKPILLSCLSWLAVPAFCAAAWAPPAAGADEWDGAAFAQKTSGGTQAWLVLPTKLVLDNADLPKAPASQPFELKAGRGEHECVQLVVRPASDLRNVSVAFTDFVNGAHRIGSAAGTANKVGTVHVQANPLGQVVRAQGPVPDPLLPESAFDLKGGALNTLWLTIRVPKDAAPGRYTGRVQIRAANAAVLEVPLSLRVWNHTIPDETHLFAVGNVWTYAERMKGGRNISSLEALRPYYDNLKAHRLNGAVVPGEFSVIWERGKPAPDTTQYEKLLRYLLDDLAFVRFRMPGTGGAANGRWRDIPVFQDVPPPDGWIDAKASVRADPADPKKPAWREYVIEVKQAGPRWIWLQGEPFGGSEKKVVSVDGRPVGAVERAAFRRHQLGFGRVDKPVTLAAGRHTLRVESDNPKSVGPLHTVYLSAQPDPDLEKLVRSMAVLAPEFKAAFRYHLEQAAAWLKERGWLSKAQIKLKDEPNVNEYGRVAVVYEFVREVLPDSRRELTEEPHPILYRGANLWMPWPAIARVDIDDLVARKKAGDEAWIYHNIPHGLGVSPVGMRLIPWVLWRYDLDGYLFWSVNFWGDDPWNPGRSGNSFMRGTMLYPNPKDGTPVNSIRWELFREGLEDYETLRLLKLAAQDARKRGGGDARTEAALRDAGRLLGDGVNALVPGVNRFNWDPVALEQTRTQVGETLSALSAPTSAARKE